MKEATARVHEIQGLIALMQKNMECAICLDLLKNPVSTKCDHQFCRFCITECLQGKASAPCPLCKKPITRRSLIDRPKLADIINGIHNLITAIQSDTGISMSHLDLNYEYPEQPSTSSNSSKRSLPPYSSIVSSKRPLSSQQIEKNLYNIRHSKRRKTEETHVFIDDLSKPDDTSQLVVTHVNVSGGFPSSKLSKGKANIKSTNRKKQSNLEDKPGGSNSHEVELVRYLAEGPCGAEIVQGQRLPARPSIQIEHYKSVDETEISNKRTEESVVVQKKKSSSVGITTPVKNRRLPPPGVFLPSDAKHQPVQSSETDDFSEGEIVLAENDFVRAISRPCYKDTRAVTKTQNQPSKFPNIKSKPQTCIESHSKDPVPTSDLDYGFMQERFGPCTPQGLLTPLLGSSSQKTSPANAKKELFNGTPSFSEKSKFIRTYGGDRKSKRISKWIYNIPKDAETPDNHFGNPENNLEPPVLQLASPYKHLASPDKHLASPVNPSESPKKGSLGNLISNLVYRLETISDNDNSCSEIQRTEKPSHTSSETDKEAIVPQNKDLNKSPTVARRRKRIFRNKTAPTLTLQVVYPQGRSATETDPYEFIPSQRTPKHVKKKRVGKQAGWGSRRSKSRRKLNNKQPLTIQEKEHRRDSTALASEDVIQIVDGGLDLNKNADQSSYVLQNRYPNQVENDMLGVSNSSKQTTCDKSFSCNPLIEKTCDTESDSDLNTIPPTNSAFIHPVKQTRNKIQQPGHEMFNRLPFKIDRSTRGKTRKGKVVKMDTAEADKKAMDQMVSKISQAEEFDLMFCSQDVHSRLSTVEETDCESPKKFHRSEGSAVQSESSTAANSARNCDSPMEPVHLIREVPAHQLESPTAANIARNWDTSMGTAHQIREVSESSKANNKDKDNIRDSSSRFNAPQGTSHLSDSPNVTRKTSELQDSEKVESTPLIDTNDFSCVPPTNLQIVSYESLHTHSDVDKTKQVPSSTGAANVTASNARTPERLSSQRSILLSADVIAPTLSKIGKILKSIQVKRKSSSNSSTPVKNSGSSPCAEESRVASVSSGTPPVISNNIHIITDSAEKPLPQLHVPKSVNIIPDVASDHCKKINNPSTRICAYTTTAIPDTQISMSKGHDSNLPNQPLNSCNMTEEFHGMAINKQLEQISVYHLSNSNSKTAERDPTISDNMELEFVDKISVNKKHHHRSAPLPPISLSTVPETDGKISKCIQQNPIQSRKSLNMSSDFVDSISVNKKQNPSSACRTHTESSECNGGYSETDVQPFAIQLGKTGRSVVLETQSNAQQLKTTLPQEMIEMPATSPSGPSVLFFTEDSDSSSTEDLHINPTSQEYAKPTAGQKSFKNTIKVNKDDPNKETIVLSDNKTENRNNKDNDELEKSQGQNSHKFPEKAVVINGLVSDMTITPLSKSNIPSTNRKDVCEQRSVTDGEIDCKQSIQIVGESMLTKDTDVTLTNTGLILPSPTEDHSISEQDADVLEAACNSPIVSPNKANTSRNEAEETGNDNSISRGKLNITNVVADDSRKETKTSNLTGSSKIWKSGKANSLRHDQLVLKELKRNVEFETQSMTNGDPVSEKELIESPESNVTDNYQVVEKVLTPTTNPAKNPLDADDLSDFKSLRSLCLLDDSSHDLPTKIHPVPSQSQLDVEGEIELLDKIQASMKEIPIKLTPVDTELTSISDSQISYLMKEEKKSLSSISNTQLSDHKKRTSHSPSALDSENPGHDAKNSHNNPERTISRNVNRTCINSLDSEMDVKKSSIDGVDGTDEVDTDKIVVIPESFESTQADVSDAKPAVQVFKEPSPQSTEQPDLKSSEISSSEVLQSTDGSSMIPTTPGASNKVAQVIKLSLSSTSTVLEPVEVLQDVSVQFSEENHSLITRTQSTQRRRSLSQNKFLGADICEMTLENVESGSFSGTLSDCGTGDSSALSISRTREHPNSSTFVDDDTVKDTAVAPSEEEDLTVLAINQTRKQSSSSLISHTKDRPNSSTTVHNSTAEDTAVAESKEEEFTVLANSPARKHKENLPCLDKFAVKNATEEGCDPKAGSPFVICVEEITRETCGEESTDETLPPTTDIDLYLDETNLEMNPEVNSVKCDSLRYNKKQSDAVLHNSAEVVRDKSGNVIDNIASMKLGSFRNKVNRKRTRRSVEGSNSDSNSDPEPFKEEVLRRRRKRTRGLRHMSQISQSLRSTASSVSQSVLTHGIDLTHVPKTKVNRNEAVLESVMTMKETDRFTGSDCELPDIVPTNEIKSLGIQTVCSLSKSSQDNSSPSKDFQQSVNLINSLAKCQVLKSKMVRKMFSADRSPSKSVEKSMQPNDKVAGEGQSDVSVAKGDSNPELYQTLDSNNVTPEEVSNTSHKDDSSENPNEKTANTSPPQIQTRNSTCEQLSSKYLNETLTERTQKRTVKSSRRSRSQKGENSDSQKSPDGVVHKKRRRKAARKPVIVETDSESTDSPFELIDSPNHSDDEVQGHTHNSKKPVEELPEFRLIAADVLHNHEERSNQEKKSDYEVQVIKDDTEDEDLDCSQASKVTNLTASSALSSQSELLGTQQRSKLELDVERMRREIEALEAQLAVRDSLLLETTINESLHLQKNNDTATPETMKCGQEIVDSEKMGTVLSLNEPTKKETCQEKLGTNLKESMKADTGLSDGKVDDVLIKEGKDIQVNSRQKPWHKISSNNLSKETDLQKDCHKKFTKATADDCTELEKGAFEEDAYISDKSMSKPMDEQEHGVANTDTASMQESYSQRRRRKVNQSHQEKKTVRKNSKKSLLHDQEDGVIVDQRSDIFGDKGLRTTDTLTSEASNDGYCNPTDESKVREPACENKLVIVEEHDRVSPEDNKTVIPSSIETPPHNKETNKHKSTVCASDDELTNEIPPTDRKENQRDDGGDSSGESEDLFLSPRSPSPPPEIPTQNIKSSAVSKAVTRLREMFKSVSPSSLSPDKKYRSLSQTPPSSPVDRHPKTSTDRLGQAVEKKSYDIETISRTHRAETPKEKSVKTGDSLLLPADSALPSTSSKTNINVPESPVSRVQLFNPKSFQSPAFAGVGLAKKVFTTPSRSTASPGRDGLTTPVRDYNSSNRKLCFVTTGLHLQQAQSTQKFAQFVDAKVQPKFSAATTHVIVKTVSEEKLVCERTFKYFQGIAHHCWIISYKWVEDSIKAKEILPESAYEIQGDTVSGSKHRGPRRSRLFSVPVFSDLEFYCRGKAYDIPPGEFEKLLTVSGATVVTSPDALGVDPDKTKLIIDVNEEPISADIRVYNRLYRQYGVVAISREWVFNSITLYKTQPLDDHILTTVSNLDIPFV